MNWIRGRRRSDALAASPTKDATPDEASGEPTIRYLVVGGGLTGDAACRGILEVDPDPGAIMLVSGELHPPYARPPLSKALWKGTAECTIWRLTANLGIHERLGRHPPLGGWAPGAPTAAAAQRRADGRIELRR